MQRDAREKRGETLTAEQEAAIKDPILEQFAHQSHPLYAAARLWDDGVIDRARPAPFWRSRCRLR